MSLPWVRTATRRPPTPRARRWSSTLGERVGAGPPVDGRSLHRRGRRRSRRPGPGWSSPAGSGSAPARGPRTTPWRSTPAPRRPCTPPRGPGPARRTAVVAERRVASSTRSARTVGTSSTLAPRRCRRSTCSRARRSAVTATVQPARGSIPESFPPDVAACFGPGYGRENSCSPSFRAPGSPGRRPRSPSCLPARRYAAPVRWRKRGSGCNRSARHSPLGGSRAYESEGQQFRLLHEVLGGLRRAS